MTLRSIRRLASIDRAELRFRAACATRKVIDRTRAALASPSWHRDDFARRLSANAPDAARVALKARRWPEAHRALAEHFASRTSTFPLQATALPELASAIRLHFPAAASEASARAAKILAGRYDVLGYTDVPFGTPPDWHRDPVNGASAPRLFWSSVPYLSSECGDHKVIWEVNRHQHWIALGRNRLLNADRACYRAFVGQLEHWLAENPPLVGVNWASMLELAFRGLSWVWALHLFAADARHDTADGAPWTVDLLLALDTQLTHVEHNLSRYFSPNTHLTGEALALYVAGHALPELAASAHRIDVGREILLAEIERQILTDGGHAELSTHYHRYTTDFYLLALLVARGAGDPAAERFEDAAHRLARYLRTISDDSGRFPPIGDDDGGQTFEVSGRPSSDASATLSVASVALDDARLAIGPLAEEALWLCGPDAVDAETIGRARAWRSTALPDSGYYVLRTSAGDHLVMDAGPHGYLNGGHAHADALSVVLTLGGTPLLVDPGAAVYTVDPVLRDRFRSSAMHNTVMLDGRPLAEPLGPFHWRSRVDARADLWRPGHRADYVEGSHTAYAPVRHTRGVLAIEGFGWLIFDHFLARGRVRAEAFWHLHPDWFVDSCTEGAANVRHRSGVRTVLATTATLRALAPGDPSGLTLVAPAYGHIVEAPVLTAQATMELPASFVTFISADPAIAGDVRITPVRASGLPRHLWNMSGIEIAFDGGFATAICAVPRTAEAVAVPRRRWGIEGLWTDGRVAASVARAWSSPIDVVIDGETTERPSEPITATVLEPVTK